MKIGELCKLANVSKELVRHYETLGLIESRELIAGSRRYRLFDEETLLRLSIIKTGKKIGFSLREIKPLLDAYLSNDLTNKEVLAILEKQHHKLSMKVDELEEVKTLIEYKINLLS